MADMEIGYFGDERLRKNGALFAQRVSERQDVCIPGSETIGRSKCGCGAFCTTRR